MDRWRDGEMERWRDGEIEIEIYNDIHVSIESWFRGAISQLAVVNYSYHLLLSSPCSPNPETPKLGAATAALHKPQLSTGPTS